MAKTRLAVAWSLCKRRLLFAAALAAVSAGLNVSPVLAESQISIDLANEAAGTATLPIQPGTYKVTVTNLAPHYFADTTLAQGRYEISIVLETQEVPPLHYPPTAGDGTKGGGPCEAFGKALLKLEDEAEAADYAQNTISAKCREGDTALMHLLARRSQSFGSYKVDGGQTLSITISRGAGSTKRTWQRSYSAGAAQGFLTSYGFNFIPSNNREYYTKSGPPASGSTAPSYTITEESNRSSLDFAPSIFFSYPVTRLAPRLDLGVSAGLGFDLTAPVVFLGLAAILNQNIHLVAGGVVHQETRLRGEYTAGQQVSENLQSDQLTEKTYAPAFFFGLSFRFDSNPFAGASAPSKVKTAAPVPAPPASGDASPKKDAATPTPTSPPPTSN
jgi:hypothetical protein